MTFYSILLLDATLLNQMNDIYIKALRFASSQYRGKRLAFLNTRTLTQPYRSVIALKKGVHIQIKNRNNWIFVETLFHSVKTNKELLILCIL